MNLNLNLNLMLPTPAAKSRKNFALIFLYPLRGFIFLTRQRISVLAVDEYNFSSNFSNLPFQTVSWRNWKKLID